MIGIVLFVGCSHFTCTFFLVSRSYREVCCSEKGNYYTKQVRWMFWLRSPVPPPPTCSSWAQLAWQWYYPDAVSPQWDCCEPSSGRVFPRGYYCKHKALYQYIPPNRHLGFLFPILIWSIATWPWSAVWMRVPPMKQMLEYHTWSDRNTNCGVDWVFRASDAFAKKTVYRAYTVTCMCELWIELFY